MKKMLCFCVTVAVCFLLCSCSSYSVRQVFNEDSPGWVYSSITENVPPPWFGDVIESKIHSESIVITYKDVPKSSAISYITHLKYNGFRINASSNETINSISYIADNKDGTHISFNYYTGGMTISIDKKNR